MISPAQRISIIVEIRPRWRRARRALNLLGNTRLILAVFAIWAAATLFDTGIWQQRIVLSGPFKPVGGLAWAYQGRDLHAPVHRIFTFLTDIRAAPDQADLLLNDHTGPLGPAHASGDAIRHEGKGRFSYQAFELTLSSRDGADPNAEPGMFAATAGVVLRPGIAHGIDALAIILAVLASVRLFAKPDTQERLARFGSAIVRWRARHAGWLGRVVRRLESAAPVVFALLSVLLGVELLLGFGLVAGQGDRIDSGGAPPDFLVWLTLLFWASALWLLSRRLGGISHRAVLAGIGLFILLYDSGLLTLWLPNTVFVTEDTPGYWGFYVVRTAGYPLLLHLFASLPGGMHSLVLLQFAAAGLATLLLAAAILSVFDSALLAAVIGMLLTVKQGPIALHFMLMTDSLFFSCCTAGLALAMLVYQRPSWRRIAYIAAIFIAASLLRPAVVGIAPPFLLVALLLWPKRRVQALVLAMAILGSLGVNALVHPLVAAAIGRPDAVAGAMSDYSLMESAAFLLTPETPSANPVLRDRLALDAAPFRQALIEAHDEGDRYVVLLHAGDDFLFGHALKTTCAVVQAPCRNPLGLDVARAMHPVGIEAIEHDPVGMIRLVFMRFAADARFAFTGDWLLRQENAFASTARGRGIFGRQQQDLSLDRYATRPTANYVAPDTLGIDSWAADHWSLLNRLTLCCMLGTLAIVGWNAIMGGLNPAKTALALSSLGLLTYHLMLALGQTAFGRYSDAVAAWLILTLGGTALLLARGLISVGATMSRRLQRGSGLFTR